MRWETKFGKEWTTFGYEKKKKKVMEKELVVLGNFISFPFISLVVVIIILDSS